VNQRVVLPLILGMLLLLVGMYSWSWTGALLQKTERQLLDEYQVRGHKTPARDDIVLLAVDDDSITRAQAWPEDIQTSPALQAMQGRFTSWPRRIWAMTLDRLMQAGARQVFLDLTLFGTTTPEDDKALADALQRYKGKVILGARFNKSGGKIDYPNPAITGSEYPPDGTWGYLNFYADLEDDVIRKARYQTTQSKVEDSLPGFNDPWLPSVALALARHIDASAGAKVGEWQRLRFCSPGAYPYISLHHIFVPDLWKANLKEGAIFKGKTVLLGVTTQEQHDVFSTPLGDMQGVEIHAHALTALLSHSFLRSAPWWWVIFSLVTGAVLAWIMVTWHRQPVLNLLVQWAITAGVYWMTFEAFETKNFEISPIPFALALNGCGILGLTGNFLSHLRESRKLSGFISRYHSPDRVHQLLRDRGGLFETLGGVERTVTILFSDVRGFTSHSEGMGPKQLVLQLNEYLSGMVEQVIVHEGGIDKFVGDAVMALWGSMPRMTEDGDGTSRDAQRAVASALAMRERLIVLNADWVKRGMHEWRFGLGIHQGNVVVANIGSAPPYERMELTVIGDNVNLSSRLESSTKDYECDIIVSEAIYPHIQSTHLCRPLGETKVKGKEIGVKIYFVEGLREGRTDPQWYPLYAEAMQALFLEKRPSKARALLEQCHAQAPEDGMINRFLAKLG
jgi:adenylate cyclase